MLAERAERTPADVPRLAEMLEHVVARVHSDVACLWSKTLDHRLPSRFAATYVEHAADLAADEKLAERDGHTDFALETCACRDPILWITVPPVEIRTIVAFHGCFGGWKHWRHIVCGRMTLHLDDGGCW